MGVLIGSSKYAAERLPKEARGELNDLSARVLVKGCKLRGMLNTMENRFAKAKSPDLLLLDDLNAALAMSEF